jgi:hypothetical protein
MTRSLQLPAELKELVDDGLWPLDNQACQLQNLYPLIPREIIRTFAPDEETIVLYPFQFCTVEEARKSNSYWEDERSAIGEIDPDLSLIIGDFGLGSDTAIVLDYRTAHPRLLRLQWGADENHWVDCGLSIAELAAHIRRHQAELSTSPNRGPASPPANSSSDGGPPSVS